MSVNFYTEVTATAFPVDDLIYIVVDHYFTFNMLVDVFTW